MPDTTHNPTVQLVDVALADLDRVRQIIDGARVSLAAAAETVDTSRTGLLALREATTGANR